MNEIYIGREHESSVASLSKWLLSTVPFIQMASRRLQSSNVEILPPLVLLFPGFSSVQSSPSVIFDSLWPCGLQHARPPCPSPTPRIYSNSCPLNRWFHPTISSSVIPFSCPQAFIKVFSDESVLHIRWPKCWRFSSASVLPMNIQDWFPLGWADWISLQSKGLSRVFSNTTV